MKYLQDDQGRTIPLPDDVQLFKRVVVFTNFAIAGDFSSDFEIPNNSENKAILSIYGLNQINKLIQKPFHFFIDGNSVSDGRVFIRGVADTIDCFFVAGNGNWMNQITGSIKDIDLSDYNVPFDAASVVANMNNTEGVIFPVMDWCYNYRKLSNAFMVSPISGVSIDSFYDFYPCFHVKTILKRLLNSYGYILAGNLLDDPSYNDLVITPEEIQSAVYEARLNASTAFTQSMQGEALGISPVFPAKASMQSGTSFFDNANDRLVFPTALTDVSFTATYIRSGSGTTKVTFQIRRNGIVESTLEVGAGVNEGTQSVVLDIEAGDYVEIYISTGSYQLTLTANYNGDIATEGVIVSQLLPQIEQIDFVKYVAQRFNCLIDFNDKTQTLTFTLLDSLRKEDAVDMTRNMTSYQYVPASGYAERNYIRTTEADELVNYKSGNLNYGDSVIESDGDGEQDVIQTPFRPAETFTNSKLNWLLTSVPLVRLEDADDGVDYVNVQDPTGVSGKAEFVNAQEFASYLVDSVVRIESVSGEYSGFAVIEEADTSGLIPYGVNFGSADTGKIYKQKIVFFGIGSRELLVCRNIDVNDINTGSTIYGSINLQVKDEDETYPIDNISWAYHAKPNIGTALDLFRVGLNYGPVINTANITFGQKYHKNLRKIVKGSHILAQMILSQTEFNNLNLKRFVYLSTKDATGYFLIIDFQDGYTDQYTPVEMDLVYMGNG